MFAFAVFDKKQNTIFIARDRTGQKPLYYYYDNRTFAFGSSIYSLLVFNNVKTSINYYKLNEFFVYNYPQSNTKTIFDSINKLPPASLLIYGGNNIEVKRY